MNRMHLIEVVRFGVCHALQALGMGRNLACKVSNVYQREGPQSGYLIDTDFDATDQIPTSYRDIGWPSRLS